MIRNNIEGFVRDGGRLYVTDRAYNFIEQVEGFARFIDFGPGESGAEPEGFDDALMGSTAETSARILEGELERWLMAVEDSTGESLLSPGGQLELRHLAGGWAMQRAVHEDARVWLQADVEGFSIGPMGEDNGSLSGSLPMMTSIDYESCGRIVFSSYHTAGRMGEGAFPEYCDSSGLSPQERALEYTIFYALDCFF